MQAIGQEQQSSVGHKLAAAASMETTLTARGVESTGPSQRDVDSDLGLEQADTGPAGGCVRTLAEDEDRAAMTSARAPKPRENMSLRAIAM